MHDIYDPPPALEQEWTPPKGEPLIFTTGDTFATDTSSLLRDAGVPSLVKPYDFAKLESVLREVALAAKTST